MVLFVGYALLARSSAVSWGDLIDDANERENMFEIDETLMRR